MLEQRTDAWIELRKKMIGASDAPVIMGESLTKTPYALWLEKIGQGEDTPANYAMQRGIRLEEKALKAFNDITGFDMAPEVVFSETIEWMMASLDGISKDRRNIVEIKCPGKEDHAIALDGHVPKKYYAQLQHQLETTKLSKAYYFSFDGENGVIVEVYRDKEYIANMILEEQKFYNYMQDFISPPLCDRDYENKDSEGWIEIVKKYKESSIRAKLANNEEEKYKNMLIAMSNNRNCKGGGIRLSRIGRKGAVDYSKIPELQDVNLDQYRKPGSYYWTVKLDNEDV